MALTDIQFVNGRLNMFLPIGSSPDTNIDGLTLSEVINNLTISLSGVKSITDQFVFNSGQVSASVNSVTYSGFQDIFETYQYTESYPATGVNPTPAQSAFLSQQAFTNFTIAGTTISVVGLDGVTVVATYAMDDDTSPTQRIRLT